MQERKPLHILFLSVFFIVSVGGAFIGGYTLGHKKSTIILNAPTIKNQDAAFPVTQADFAPFWNAWALLDQKFASAKATSTKPVTDQEKVWGAIQGLAGSLGDPYTVFFPPEQNKSFKESIAGEFSGVGMEVGMRDRILTVIAPLKGSPSELAGVKVGDKILKIDKETTANLSVEDAVERIRGKKGTTVTLNLYRESRKEPFDISIVRDIIQIPTIDTEVKDGVFIVRLYSFTAQSPDLFRAALQKFTEAKTDKLILDLRGNPGGYLEAAVDMASWFLPAGKTIVRESFKDRPEEIYRSKGYNIFGDNLKMVILVNGGSASASEILAGALHEHGRAKLVGEKTFGKGSVQELVPVTDDTSLKITIARWLTPDGVSISESGIIPDTVVAPAKEGEKELDPQQKKAFEILNNWK